MAASSACRGTTLRNSPGDAGEKPAGVGGMFALVGGGATAGWVSETGGTVFAGLTEAATGAAARDE
jgi:hypothetical protein